MLGIYRVRALHAEPKLARNIYRAIDLDKLARTIAWLLPGLFLRPEGRRGLLVVEQFAWTRTGHRCFKAQPQGKKVGAKAITTRSARGRDKEGIEW